jgi:signal transduction histidine kinase
MTIRKLIRNDFDTVEAYQGVRSILDLLDLKKYLVVTEGDDYRGILTPSDLVQRPYKIIIDCLSPKDKVSPSEPIASVHLKFKKTKSPALPVFDEEHFLGVIDFLDFIEHQKTLIEEHKAKSLISENIKKSFLSNLSHEIRTPLNGVLGFLDIISQLNADELQQKGEEYFQIVRRLTDKFLIIINDLIQLAKIENGENPQPEFSPCLLKSIFDELKDYFETDYRLAPGREEQKQIIIHSPPHEPELFNDPQKIKHIIFHLLDNALKFSADGVVNLSYTINEDYVSISVSNNGETISSENREKIFTVFGKGESEISKINGLGIGLPLVKKLTEILNGTISFKSENSSTSFLVTIPQQKQDHLQSDLFPPA